MEPADHRQDISDERRAERVSAEDTDKVSIGSGAPHHCSWRNSTTYYYY